MALVIEDVEITRRFTRRMLEKMGIRTVDLHSGVHAERAVRENCPDLVITDLALPERSGLEVIRGLKEDFPDLPILAFTGMTLDDMALRAGADLVLFKPSSFHELESAINQLLGPPGKIRGTIR